MQKLTCFSQYSQLYSTTMQDKNCFSNCVAPCDCASANKCPPTPAPPTPVLVFTPAPLTAPVPPVQTTKANVFSSTTMISTADEPFYSTANQDTNTPFYSLPSTNNFLQSTTVLLNAISTTSFISKNVIFLFIFYFFFFQNVNK